MENAPVAITDRSPMRREVAVCLVRAGVLLSADGAAMRQIALGVRTPFIVVMVSGKAVRTMNCIVP